MSASWFQEFAVRKYILCRRFLGQYFPRMQVQKHCCRSSHQNFSHADGVRGRANESARNIHTKEVSLNTASAVEHVLMPTARNEARWYLSVWLMEFIGRESLTVVYGACLVATLVEARQVSSASSPASSLCRSPVWWSQRVVCGRSSGPQSILLAWSLTK